MSQKVTKILLVEDSPGDVRLAQEAFGDADVSIHLHVVSDGQEAMAFLRREGATPMRRDAFEALVNSLSDFWMTKATLPLPGPGDE